MKNIIIKTTALMTILSVTVIPLLAQGPGAPPATPIDGGLSLLLAAGGVYGLKKLKESRK
ncbi:MAG: hypothetical protein JXR03_20720 [Cyclobacteriaceae bacterium]